MSIKDFMLILFILFLHKAGHSTLRKEHFSFLFLILISSQPLLFLQYILHFHIFVNCLLLRNCYRHNLTLFFMMLKSIYTLI